jgi:cell division protein FtsL
MITTACVVVAIIIAIFVAVAIVEMYRVALEMESLKKRIASIETSMPSWDS